MSSSFTRKHTVIVIALVVAARVFAVVLLLLPESANPKSQKKKFTKKVAKIDLGRVLRVLLALGGWLGLFFLF